MTAVTGPAPAISPHPEGHPVTTPALDPDQPIPYTLTALAHVALTEPGILPGACDDWSCHRCGLGYFGSRPDSGLCVPCLAAVDGRT
jgi:hypothetical protein